MRWFNSVTRPSCLFAVCRPVAAGGQHSGSEQRRTSPNGQQGCRCRQQDDHQDERVRQCKETLDDMWPPYGNIELGCTAEIMTSHSRKNAGGLLSFIKYPSNNEPAWEKTGSHLWVWVTCHEMLEYLLYNRPSPDMRMLFGCAFSW